MLFYNSEFKWEDEIKDSDLINFYYNLYNLRRYIKVKLHDMVIEPPKKSLFSKKTIETPAIELPMENTDIDILAAKYRAILEKYDPKNIRSFADLLTLIDEFSDFVLFLHRVHQPSPFISIEAKENKSIKYLSINDIEIEIEYSMIPNPSKSGSLILDMIDGNDNKYIITYHITRYGKTSKYITGESPIFKNSEELINFIKMTDIIIDKMFRYIVECVVDMIDFVSFNGEPDYKIISDNLTKGKIYVRK